MHAEMHAIFTATGMSPAFKKQIAAKNRLQPPPPPTTSFDPGLETPQRLSAGLHPSHYHHNNCIYARDSVSDSEDWSSNDDQFFRSGRQRSFQQQQQQHLQPKVEGWKNLKGQGQQAEAAVQQQSWPSLQLQLPRTRARVCVELSI
jgi:hypothetical protein